MCAGVCACAVPPGPLKELIFYAFTIILIVYSLLVNGSFLPLKEFKVMKNSGACILMNCLNIKTKYMRCTKYWVKLYACINVKRLLPHSVDKSNIS